jgi:hypothetical protein
MEIKNAAPFRIFGVKHEFCIIIITCYSLTSCYLKHDVIHIILSFNMMFSDNMLSFYLIFFPENLTHSYSGR